MRRDTERGKYCETVNAHKLRPYDNARAGAVCKLNPISLSGVRPRDTLLAGCRHVASQLCSLDRIVGGFNGTGITEE